MSGRAHRLYNGETTVDFYGRRKIAFAASAIAFLIAVVSLLFQGIELGIDFKGGVSWEAPISNELNSDKAREILNSNGLVGANAKVQILTAGNVQRVRIQVGELPSDTRIKIQQDLAAAAGVEIIEVSVADVSSTWGRSITEKAIRALLVFVIAASVFIAWRFEWKMAVAAIVAMLHDVILSIGVYSLFQFEVTPATVVAFLTILGFSLYDTIVVFDCVKENSRRLNGAKISYGDIVNVSMNEVLMRSINTTISTLLPVLSLLIVGSWIMGAASLREFAVALLVGLGFGTYSSIYIAAPLLGVLKSREPQYRPYADQLAKGEDLAALIATGAASKRRSSTSAQSGNADISAERDPVSASRAAATAETLLSHPPRPRKKSRR
jgi:preprotein translocase subunit SecF